MHLNNDLNTEFRVTRDPSKYMKNDDTEDTVHLEMTGPNQNSNERF